MFRSVGLLFAQRVSSCIVWLSSSSTIFLFARRVTSSIARSGRLVSLSSCFSFYSTGSLRLLRQTSVGGLLLTASIAPVARSCDSFFIAPVGRPVSLSSRVLFILSVMPGGRSA